MKEYRQAAPPRRIQKFTETPAAFRVEPTLDGDPFAAAWPARIGRPGGDINVHRTLANSGLSCLAAVPLRPALLNRRTQGRNMQAAVTPIANQLETHNNMRHGLEPWPDNARYGTSFAMI